MPLASGTQLSCTAVPAPHLKPGAVAISTDATTCVDTYVSFDVRQLRCPEAGHRTYVSFAPYLKQGTPGHVP